MCIQLQNENEIERLFMRWPIGKDVMHSSGAFIGKVVAHLEKQDGKPWYGIAVKRITGHYYPSAYRAGYTVRAGELPEFFEVGTIEDYFSSFIGIDKIKSIVNRSDLRVFAWKQGYLVALYDDGDPSVGIDPSVVAFTKGGLNVHGPSEHVLICEHENYGDDTSLIEVANWLDHYFNPED